MAKRQGHFEGNEELLTRKKVKKPRRYKVILHNDDFTTMDFVIAVLMNYFGKTSDQAVKQMWEVHLQGRTIAGLYPKEIAETKAALVIRDARKQGFPFMATVELE